MFIFAWHNASIFSCLLTLFEINFARLAVTKLVKAQTPPTTPKPTATGSPTPVSPVPKPPPLKATDRVPEPAHKFKRALLERLYFLYVFSLS